VARRLCTDLWRDTRGARRPLATHDKAPQLGAPPAARDGGQSIRTFSSPAFPADRPGPMLRAWYGQSARRRRRDTIYGPPGR
jgi:hypothetical protein